MAGLADLTFFSELKYPDILHEETYTASTTGVNILKTGVPTNARVVAWGMLDPFTSIGATSYIANDRIYISPSGELRCYMLSGDKITYRIYAV